MWLASLQWVNSVSDFYILEQFWFPTSGQIHSGSLWFFSFLKCLLFVSFRRCSTPQVAALVFMLWSALTNRWPRQAQLLWEQVFTKAQIFSHLSHCLDTFVAVRRGERNEWRKWKREKWSREIVLFRAGFSSKAVQVYLRKKVEIKVCVFFFFIFHHLFLVSKLVQLFLQNKGKILETYITFFFLWL